ncbi:MAG TPA: hypothetical protein VGH81_01320 [Rudaea sp.]|jgi:hypothetical protein
MPQESNAPDGARPSRAALIAELRQVWRTPPFFFSALRNATSVVGVLFLGWSALELALYFVIQSWLMLSLYAATDLTFNPKYGGHPPRSLREALATPVQNLVGALVVVGFLIGLFGWFLLSGMFGADDWQAFLQGGWQQPSFLYGLLILLASCLSEAAVFAQRLPTRSAAQVETDDLRIASLFYRLVLLLAASIFLGATRGTALAAPLFALALVQVYFEALPRSSAAFLGMFVGRRG